jgi:hypothetical protein
MPFKTVLIVNMSGHTLQTVINPKISSDDVHKFCLNYINAHYDITNNDSDSDDKKPHSHSHSHSLSHIDTGTYISYNQFPNPTEYSILSIKKIHSKLFYSYNESKTIAKIIVVDINEDSIGLLKSSSSANLLLNIKYAMSDIEFDLDQFVELKPNGKYVPMWMVFDQTGKYHSVYRTLAGARQFLITHANTNANGVPYFFPELDDKDNQLIVVSLAFDNSNLIYYACRVQINLLSGIKAQINIFKDLCAEHIHKYIIL